MITNPTTKTILNYLSYLSLFIGTGFISGAIVHSGRISEIPKYIAIGVLGVFLFAIGSLTQEILSGKHSMNKLEAAKFFLFSLFLSIGIGMISGGFQHFTDFPAYSSFLIPIGFILSWCAFLFKNNAGFNSRILATTVGILVLCLPLYLGLSAYAKSLAVQNCEASMGLLSIRASASEGHSDNNCNQQNVSIISKSNNLSHDSMTKTSVVNDKTFIEYVIPHHQDAVNGSLKVLAITQDSELTAFLNNVIKTQNSEIVLLKSYFKTWYGEDYKDNGEYQSMMKVTKTGLEVEKEYIQGMLGHHSGIIDVAKKVVASDLGYTYKPEVIALSRQIIKDQEADNILLNKWLGEKYGVSNAKETHDESNEHAGH
jgi:uncharacterized protein (DUF305 family)